MREEEVCVVNLERSVRGEDVVDAWWCRSEWELMKMLLSSELRSLVRVGLRVPRIREIVVVCKIC